MPFLSSITILAFQDTQPLPELVQDGSSSKSGMFMARAMAVIRWS